MTYLPIFIFIGAIIAVLWIISIYFVITKRLDAGDMWAKSLGLPRGSIRAIVALLFIFFIAYAIFSGDDLPDKIPDWILGIMGTIIGFYFGSALVPPPEKSKSSEKR